MYLEFILGEAYISVYGLPDTESPPVTIKLESDAILLVQLSTIEHRICDKRALSLSQRWFVVIFL